MVHQLHGSGLSLLPSGEAKHPDAG